MKKTPCAARIFLALLPLLTISPSAQAVATWNRVFVSTTGNDANNCSDPATPCRSFIGAQAQTNVGGEIIVMTTGGYGLLNVTQSVTINGPAGVVIFSNFPVTVNAPGASVVLRGLTIDGTGQTGNGINVTAVGDLHVESCVITGWVGGGGAVNGDGISFLAAGRLFVKDTIIRDNSAAGIWVNPATGTAQASIDHSRLEKNFWGMDVPSNGKATIKDSVLSGNGAAGLQTEGGEANAEDCLFANNDYGVSANPGTIRVSNCTVTDNSTGLYAATAFGGTLLSRGNNTVEGNTTAGAFTGTYLAK